MIKMDETVKSPQESEISEWKWSWRDEYLKWLCAYANKDGGKLFIGVNDDGYAVGLKDVRKLQEDIPNKIISKLHIVPRVILRHADTIGKNIRYDTVPPDISEKQINQYACGVFVPVTERDQKKLAFWIKENPVVQDPDGNYYYLEIEVDPYPNLITYNGVAYSRSGSTLQILEGHELEKAVLKSSGLTWDEFEAVGKTVADLDHDALEAFRKKAVEKRRLTPDQTDVSDLKLLKKLQLFTETNKLMRAAVMLFGNPDSVVTGAYIKIGYFAFEGTYGDNTIYDVIYHDEIRGPLIVQADKTIDVLYAKYFKALISYDGIQRVESYMIPQDAMREIVLNAIAHKNYSSGNPIQIKVYDDHIAVMNEGHWPFDLIKVEEVYTDDHYSYPGNPKIAEGLYMAGDIETWGSGFEKIKKACLRYETPLPNIKATKENVMLTIYPSENYMRILKRKDVAADQAEPAEKPAESAEKPEEPAEKPEEPAEKPAESTKKPAESAEKPAESAEKPAESADCSKERKYKQILTVMEQGREYSTKEIGNLVSLKDSRTKELLKELAELGYLESSGNTKGRRYTKK